MTAQHHEAHIVPPGSEDPEARARLEELMTEINRYDSQIRSLPDSTEEESPIRSMQRERNELQKEYDNLAAEVRRGGTIRTAGDIQEREALLAEQRDQLVIAQNAPFTGPAPEATGGESAIPEGVVNSAVPNAFAGIPRANKAGVVHYPVAEPTDLEV